MDCLLALIAIVRAWAFALAAVWLFETVATLLDLLMAQPTPATERDHSTMAGYLNRFIHLEFPELAGVDEHERALVWVKIRNPRLIPAGELASAAESFRATADGQIVADGDKAQDATFAQFARLIIAGNVWDPTWMPEDLDSDDPGPLLPMPPTGADVRKLPAQIFNKIGEEMKKATPH